ncbi:hypothetical protein KFV02_01420 [Desulfohalobiaceae bacterium Ax17]|uniref:DUF5714 domain-containing protein n=1 Tax=Desulfovulcanus ferrireducens TaxID=2831190 RepID=UPI00207BAB8E|nr:DUF5714 domain-containing protein [Desulfovulcanus ferrireducens]MBT8762591.1 hypothetical protein [Desulfovulcanus ferrireducens]
MVCGSQLEYLNHAVELQCSSCGRLETGHIRCPNNHYVCDICHNQQAIKTIKEICLSAKSKNPFEIAEQIMALSQFPMLGCHHAFVAAGALMTAIRNEGTIRVADEQIEEAFNRTERQAIGGYCGLTGVCGIVPAIGACFSILLGSKCGTDKEQRLTMEVVSKIVHAITELTGPSCCKAYVRTALENAVHFLKDNFKICLMLPSTPIQCNSINQHPHGCRGMKCPYFSEPNI